MFLESTPSIPNQQPLSAANNVRMLAPMQSYVILQNQPCHKLNIFQADDDLSQGINRCHFEWNEDTMAAIYRERLKPQISSRLDVINRLTTPVALLDRDAPSDHSIAKQKRKQVVYLNAGEEAEDEKLERDRELMKNVMNLVT
ncbi:hypothetical protein M9H77_20421 [Catharanthus roseus]|uniref:Uncharacterized protein n=1 Tax=Catharanthus roseus TaxID=4058 RepID=A0ACC0AMC1_CATRO|nr:hypothetical protein M9H77_20421 [Catharanthus roseus]